MKNLFNILGVIIGIVIIICGVINYDDTDSFVASNNKYGADFYTDLFHEVNQVRAKVNVASNKINRGFGAVLISIGSLSICYFGNNIVTKEKTMISDK